MKKSTFWATLMAFMFGAGAAFAADYAVVDVQKVMTDSEPGKAAVAHMQEVQKVLQQGMNDLIALHKGKENTPEAQQAIAQGQQVLNRQLQVEQQATAAVMQNELNDVITAWRKKNSRTLMVINKQILLDSAPSVEITNAIMKEMNRRKPKFPDLPKVSITRPEKK